MCEEAPKAKEKTSISVSEMRKLLGIGKTDAYWLVKKKYFKTIIVAGRMRIMRDSFDTWYANQFTYHKVNGPAPGENLKDTLISVAEIAAMLELSEATVCEIINKEHLKFTYVYGKRRIVKSSFYQWYQSQSVYQTREDRLKIQTQVGETLTMPQIARLLGVHRNNVYYLVNKGCFETIRTARTRLVTKASFEKWYEGQKRFKKVISEGGDTDGIHR